MDTHLSEQFICAQWEDRYQRIYLRDRRFRFLGLKPIDGGLSPANAGTQFLRGEAHRFPCGSNKFTETVHVEKVPPKFSHAYTQPSRNMGLTGTHFGA